MPPQLKLVCLLSGVLIACGAPATTADGGADAGPADAGGPWACEPARPACDVLGSWNVTVQVRPGWDAGSFSPCLPLPALDRVATIAADGGAWCSPPAPLAHLPGDGGCGLVLDYGFRTTNPSEYYEHAVHLDLAPAGAGALSGPGLYTMTGGSNCSLPLEATATRLP